MDKYEQLRQILDAHPAGAPKSKVFHEILKILFTPDEIELAVHMSFRPKSVEHIALSASMPHDDARELLEGMASKVVIFHTTKNGTNLYGLLPTIPGLFEFPFMRGAHTPELRTLGALWEEYHREALGNAFCGRPTPQIRIVPISTSLDAAGAVHPYEEVKRLIDDADYVALTNCACRASLGKCDAPMEVCIPFGPYARFLVSRGYAREVDKAEAQDALVRAEEAGLVHTSNNSADRPVVICNCCPCCCTVLRGRIQLNNPGAFAPSRFEATVSGEDCTGCGICADDRCVFGAVSVVDGTARVDADACTGCGLCVSGCPVDAMALKERPNVPEVPKTAQELIFKVLQERGTLDEFMEIMQR